VTGIVRAFPIIYYSKRARNAMINYAKTLPAVLLWIGTDACLAAIEYPPNPYIE
jgi:branched-subunit amino acid transport protein AzlD